MKRKTRFRSRWKETEAHQWEANATDQICVMQSANSPDTNLNDLCFFRSLSNFVQEHEREIEHSAANKDKFWNLVVEQYHKYHDRERLERCWDVKTAVTECILDANGTNDYKLPHGIKHEQPTSIDMPLDSDDTDDLVARTLDYVTFLLSHSIYRADVLPYAASQRHA